MLQHVRWNYDGLCSPRLCPALTQSDLNQDGPSVAPEDVRAFFGRSGGPFAQTASDPNQRPPSAEILRGWEVEAAWLALEKGVKSGEDPAFTHSLLAVNTTGIPFWSRCTTHFSRF